MKKLLVVVDYQNDFVDGALGFPGADQIENNIIELIEEFQKNNDYICFTLDTHEPDYMNTTEGHYLPVEHCIKNTKGWELRERLQKYVGNNPVFEKHTFGSLELGNYIQKLGVNEVTLVGLVSNICVISNAIIAKAALDKNGVVKVVRNATSSYDPVMQEKGFDILKNLHIEII